jgi:hypothetical protein
MGSGMLPSGAYVTLEHEYILVLRKGDKRRFDQTGKDRRQRSAFFWEERNVWFSDIWDFKGTRQALNDKEACRRSAAFLFELAFRLVNMYSMQMDTVLDPFVGTGTTSVASMASGRNSIGVEINAALAPTIEQTVQSMTSAINDRQIQRIRNHEAFLREYEEKRGRKFSYENRHHGFPVMTRQEVNLSIPLVTKIERIVEGEYRAHHVPYALTARTVETAGLDRHAMENAALFERAEEMSAAEYAGSPSRADRGDFERGFIRDETCPIDDLFAAGRGRNV